MRAQQVALIEAAKEDDVKALDQHLAGGANVDETDEKGWTALMWAAAFGCADAVVFLTSRKANPNHKSGKGNTALLCAAQNGLADICELLLKAGADKAVTTSNRKTPAQIAADKGHAELAKLIDSWVPAAEAAARKLVDDTKRQHDIRAEAERHRERAEAVSVYQAQNAIDFIVEQFDAISTRQHKHTQTLCWRTHPTEDISPNIIDALRDILNEHSLQEAGLLE